LRPTPLLEAHDEAHYGGKASKLARSLQAGLPVPPGFALATSLVEALASGHADAQTHLSHEFTQLGGPCAVRSSAIGEDSESASFAGQHLTLLNVHHEDHIGPAVLKVRESAHTDSAKAYRRKVGLDDRPSIAVVVQRMIEPVCAGVMFTKNPLNGADEFIIEAAWGLGEAVVAGLVVPDNYALDADGCVLRRRIGEKDLALRSNPTGGTIEETIDDERMNATCLSDSDLVQLHELATRCETHFGRGLDLEWAFANGRLYLLQCRAMTRNR
jgi:pyruvate,water dikinase